MTARKTWIDCLRDWARGPVCILAYHRVIELSSDPWQLAVSPDHFQQQMQALRQSCRPVPLAGLPGRLRSRGPRQFVVAVTFDDGYADNLQYALPVLERLEIPATLFLVAAALRESREFWWDDLERVFLQPGNLPSQLELKVAGRDCHWSLGEAAEYSVEQAAVHRRWRAWQPPPTPRHAIYCDLWKRLYAGAPPSRRAAIDAVLQWAGTDPMPRPTHRTLTAAQLATLADHPLVEIGGHTDHHRPLGLLSDGDQQLEIGSGQRTLQEMLGRPLVSFAYPHGDYRQQTIDLVRRAGFQRACTTRAGLFRPGDDPFQLPRNVMGDIDGGAAAHILSHWQRSGV